MTPQRSLELRPQQKLLLTATDKGREQQSSPLLQRHGATHQRQQIERGVDQRQCRQSITKRDIVGFGVCMAQVEYRTGQQCLIKDPFDVVALRRQRRHYHADRAALATVEQLT